MKIAVYGASGYTGTLVVAELRRRDIEAVLVGRDADRLRAVAAGAEVRPADIDHAGTAFQGCDAVINCAGPFRLLGEPVVRAAVAAGCHYVDIAGEQGYLARLFDAVEAPEVSVVPGVNDDGLPSDLLAHLVAEQVGPVRELVVGIDLAAGNPSRGTLRSALANLDTFTAGGLGYGDGRWAHDIPASRTSMAFLDKDVPVVKFPLPAVVTVPRHVRAGRVEGVARQDLAAAFVGVTTETVESMPVGPPEESRRAARWVLAVEAVGEDGRHARGVVHGSDTYGITAVIAVEAARRLVADGAKPGVLAPAQAFAARDFLAFLEGHGVTFDVVRPPRSRSSSGDPRDRT
jgi:short subunit dehydrogenase-like uncharacterized protein